MPRFVCIRARLARHHSPRAFGDYRPSCVVGRWSRLRRFDMGSWDEKPFGNDTALDWLAGLEESRDISYLANTINRISHSSDPLESPESEEAVAAAAVIAAAAVESIRQVPETAKAWILELGFTPSSDLVS